MLRCLAPAEPPRLPRPNHRMVREHARGVRFGEIKSCLYTRRSNQRVKAENEGRSLPRVYGREAVYPRQGGLELGAPVHVRIPCEWSVPTKVEIS